MKTVFVSGCYDILHGGHVEFLTAAKALGNFLIVCVPTDTVLAAHKHRRPALNVDHRVHILQALGVVDKVVVGRDEEEGLNFKSQFLALRPDILAVTEDDLYEKEKRALCDEIGAQYVKLPKTLGFAQISSTEIARYMRAPERVPLRVDFAGGWLDVPKFAVHGAHVVNCAVSPLVSLSDWPYEVGGGLGGSAAYRLLLGQNALQSELDAGVGWQDPAVINETGLCVWNSGSKPILEMKTSGRFLNGLMGIAWTGRPHSTPQLVNKPRNFKLIEKAAEVAFTGVRNNSIGHIVDAIDMSYRCQLAEGMDTIPDMPHAIAKKYLGSGWGGYVLYLFAHGKRPDNVIHVEPYTKSL
jgi:cytidyltransferase-like protein